MAIIDIWILQQELDNYYSKFVIILNIQRDWILNKMIKACE
jgi:hypothetical protein